MTAETHNIIGLDLGGTHLRGGVFNQHGECLVRDKIDSNGRDGGEAVYETLLKFLRTLPASADLAWSDISGIGLGVAGMLDVEAGIINFSPNIEGWIQFPIARKLYDEFQRPVYINNDAIIAGIGEHWRGSARSFDNFLILTLGTGIGGGIFIDGKPYLGRTGQAGELGHTTVNPFGRACLCGNIGCLEAHSSSRAVVSRFQYLSKTGKRSSLKNHLESATFTDICQAANDGDGLCQQLIIDAADYLGIGMASFINIFDPEAIILTGGMLGAIDLMMPHIRKEIDKRALISNSDDCKVLLSTLGDDAGLLGAVKWTLDALEISA